MPHNPRQFQLLQLLVLLYLAERLQAKTRIRGSRAFTVTLIRGFPLVSQTTRPGCAQCGTTNASERCDECLSEYRRTNNRTTYQLHDALGSVTLVTFNDGTAAYRSTYKAFGQMTRGTYDTWQTRLGYTGRETSVGGLMQYRSRYYDPAYGRFAQEDPAQASVALYDYAANNPATFVDPFGLYCANPSDEKYGIGVNRVKASVDAMDWSHPGICAYAGPRAENVYIDPYDSPYDLAGMGMGTLWAYHINAKLL